MFNPEDKDDAVPQKLKVSFPKRQYHSTSPVLPPMTPPVPVPTPTIGLLLQSEEEILHSYLDMSEACRNLHGFSRKRSGQVTMVDKSKAEAAAPHIKEYLRSWVRKKQEAGLWGGVAQTAVE